MGQGAAGTVADVFSSKEDKFLTLRLMEDAVTALVRERSKITAKGQSTVAKAVRQALGVSYGGEIDFVVDEGGRVSLLAAETETDPVIDGFPAFLAGDMARGTPIASRLVPAISRRG
ncbi:type II toxin-antitoxin system PrlF family antitoxin [Methylobacterium platani]|uniref:type II toxin-antitoxin system PrlF family antitoxin n=1 Tax=Methylobacterium platani TaxID=427683 RepID=UPI000ACABF03|nr:type II toxin-antitoxin system PrlF family antitoxin [Methylobacterium platani]